MKNICEQPFTIKPLYLNEKKVEKMIGEQKQRGLRRAGKEDKKHKVMVKVTRTKEIDLEG